VRMQLYLGGGKVRGEGGDWKRERGEGGWGRGEERVEGKQEKGGGWVMGRGERKWGGVGGSECGSERGGGGRREGRGEYRYWMEGPGRSEKDGG